MSKTRIKLAVYVDLDEMAGTVMHSAESARNTVSGLLHTLGYYKPMVSIESYDTSKTDGNAQLVHYPSFDGSGPICRSSVDAESTSSRFEEVTCSNCKNTRGFREDFWTSEEND